MQALKQNSSVTGAMKKLRRVCRGLTAPRRFLLASRSCSNGPANKLAVSRVGLTTACSSPAVLSPSKASSKSLGGAVCSTKVHPGHELTMFDVFGHWYMACAAYQVLFVCHRCAIDICCLSCCKRHMKHPCELFIPYCTHDDTVGARQASW